MHEERSLYSHMRVVDYGRMRALYFGESQTHLVETLVDRDRPQRLQHGYAHAMAAAFLYRPDASSALLVGLGGGALVHFINHDFPQVRLDVVEIDPAMVKLTKDWFGTGEGPRTRILVADGAEFLRRSGGRYDVILLDAHLDGGELTDPSGHPLSMKTAEFYDALRARLQPGGVVMFNMLAGAEGEAYRAGIRSAFPSVQAFRSANGGNLVVAAKADGKLAGKDELAARARVLDRRGDLGFSFSEVVGRAELH